MSALMLASKPPQDLMPTTIAIFSDQEFTPSLMQTPERRTKQHESVQTSGSKTYDVSAASVCERSSFPSSFPEGAVRAGRFKVNSGGRGPDGNGGDLPRRGEARDPLQDPDKDPWRQGRPDYSQFGTSGAGVTGGGPSDGDGRRGDDSFDTFSNGPPKSSGSEGNWLDEERRKTGGTRSGGGEGSGPPDPHGPRLGQEQELHCYYRVWDDARPSYSSQQKPQTIDKHRRRQLGSLEEY
eukprot:6490551-Amphidinium_carterae.4